MRLSRALLALVPLAGFAVTGSANEKVTICHHAGPTKVFTISVSENAVPGHLGHGDSVGECGGGGGGDPT